MVITSNDLTGHGLLTANGGKGDNNAGGGSGGRIKLGLDQM